MKRVTTCLLFLAGLLTMAGCANEDTTQQPGTNGMTEFAMVDEALLVRTAGEYTGSKLKFYWTAQDHLWLNNGSDLLQSVRDNINEQLTGSVTKVPTAKFWFAGTFSNLTYPLRYTGKNGVKDKVTIAAVQTQKLPSDASHIGESGDCGTATATKNGDHYDFTLAHKAAYFTLTPFTTDSRLTGGKLTRIKITADKPLAGTFGFGDSGLDIATAPQSPSNSITINLQGTDGTGFPLAATSSVTDNSATIVLAPGTYSTFDIEYTVINPVTHFPGTVTASYTNINFNEGKNKKLAPDLTNAVFPIHYLFHDGTTGKLAEAGSRKAIGLVIIEKTSTTDGMAIALKDAARNVYPAFQSPEWDALEDNAAPNFQSNTQVFAAYADALQDMKGYEWTWDPAYSVSGIGLKVGKKFKRTPTSPEIYRYPAFHYAGSFGDEIAEQGITVTGAMVGRKWYLPSMGEWYQLVRAFAVSGPVQSEWDSVNKMNGSVINDALTAVGGTVLGTGLNYYWTSTEYDKDNAVDATVDINGISFGHDAYKGYPQGNVRPFIHF